jgi:hypothetical protein
VRSHDEGNVREDRFSEGDTLDTPDAIRRVLDERQLEM